MIKLWRALDTFNYLVTSYFMYVTSSCLFDTVFVNLSDSSTHVMVSDLSHMLFSYNIRIQYVYNLRRLSYVYSMVLVCCSLFHFDFENNHFFYDLASFHATTAQLTTPIVDDCMLLLTTSTSSPTTSKSISSFLILFCLHNTIFILDHFSLS